MVSLRGTFLRRRFLCGDGVNGLGKGVGVNRRLCGGSPELMVGGVGD